MNNVPAMHRLHVHTCKHLVQMVWSTVYSYIHVLIHCILSQSSCETLVNMDLCIFMLQLAVSHTSTMAQYVHSQLAPHFQNTLT